MWMTHSEPRYLEITDEWREKFEHFQQEHAGDTNGDVTPKGNPIDSFIGIVPENGNTVRVPKGNTEWTWNVGQKTYHEILVELKNT